MRFQALMPDILHWLGITKIDRMLSMSNMKHDAIVEQGIPIHERVPIPDELIPEDSRVEIDAKIHAGYFTNGKIMSMEELQSVQGRGWEDVDVSLIPDAIRCEKKILISDDSIEGLLLEKRRYSMVSFNKAHNSVIYTKKNLK